MSDALQETFYDLGELLTEVEAGRHSIVDVKTCLRTLTQMLERHGNPHLAHKALCELEHAGRELDDMRLARVRQHVRMAQRALF